MRWLSYIVENFHVIQGDISHILCFRICWLRLVPMTNYQPHEQLEKLSQRMFKVSIDRFASWHFAVFPVCQTAIRRPVTLPFLINFSSFCFIHCFLFQKCSAMCVCVCECVCVCVCACLQSVCVCVCVLSLIQSSYVKTQKLTEPKQPLLQTQ